MTERVVIRRNTYHDSVTLMLASRDAEEAAGVTFAAAVTATPVNLELLQAQGFAVADESLGPNDLVVAVRADNDEAADAAARRVDERLGAPPAAAGPSGAAPPPRSLRTAARRRPGTNLAVVAVPGQHAAYEVSAALEAGLHVFCFSDQMTLFDEALLKRRAVERGLLFMGADCGTAIIDGIALGFANAVQPGSVGIVGATGTGIQQVTCLLDDAGVGLSHVIGVGGRDLSTAVGGVMTEHALRLLTADESTDVIVVLSKPPDPEVAERIAGLAQRAGLPVVLGFLGVDGSAGIEVRGDVKLVGSLEAAAAAAAELSGAAATLEDVPLPETKSAGGIRGLFCGGSLCYEAAAVARSRPDASFVDYGEDQFTKGRAHPMIDPTLRNEAFESAADDPQVAAIVADVVLGYGAHPNPASELAPLVRIALGRRPDDLTVVIALCGTTSDPQDLRAQAQSFRDAGALVTRNAAHAGRLAIAATEPVS